jgi:hypothetical protein
MTTVLKARTAVFSASTAVFSRDHRGAGFHDSGIGGRSPVYSLHITAAFSEMTAVLNVMAWAFSPHH